MSRGQGSRRVKDEDTVVHTKDGARSKTTNRYRPPGRERVSTPCRTSCRTRHLAATCSLMEEEWGRQMDGFFQVYQL